MLKKKSLNLCRSIISNRTRPGPGLIVVVAEGANLKFLRMQGVNRAEAPRGTSDPDPERDSGRQDVFDNWLSSYRQRLDQFIGESPANSSEKDACRRVTRAAGQ
jgi:hypothetical protein